MYELAERLCMTRAELGQRLSRQELIGWRALHRQRAVEAEHERKKQAAAAKRRGPRR